jgi:hypothetical protein
MLQATATRDDVLSISMEDTTDEPRTIRGTLHVYWQERSYAPEGGKFVLFNSEDMAQYGYIYVQAVEVEVPEPEGFDPRATKLQHLRDEEQRIRAEFTARITELQRQQAELLALEMA